MPPIKTVTLTDELYEQASREAQAEGKTIDEIARDALTAYLVLLQLDRLHESGQKRSDDLDLVVGAELRPLDESRTRASVSSTEVEEPPPVLRALRGAARGISADAHCPQRQRKRR